MLNDRKLLEIPVLSVVLMFLGNVNSMSDILNVGLLNKSFRDFITRDASMNTFWYALVRRAAHKKWIVNGRYLTFQVMIQCHPKINKRICPGRTHVWGNMLRKPVKELREEFGECEDVKHLRFQIEHPDAVHGFLCVGMYDEWRRIIWKCVKHKYWNRFDEGKISKYEDEIKRLESEIKRLEHKKEMGMRLDQIYGSLKKQSKKRKIKK